MLTFFSDPHLGKTLKANTTVESRARLSEQLFLHAKAVESLAEGDYIICGGDLFDTEHNEEAVILQGAEVASFCKTVIGGNHDVANVAHHVSSLKVLERLQEERRFVLPPEPGNVRADTFSFEDSVMLAVVPHHARQEEFEQALDKAYQAAQSAPGHLRKLLLVHCNYNLKFESGQNDLNLTDAKARQMLTSFDYIIMGHDHRPRTECDGRLIVLGNTHPTCFGDLGEKFIWKYSPQENAFHRHLLCPDSSRTVEAAELLEAWTAGQLTAEFSAVEWLDVVGRVPAEQMADLSKALRAVWKVAPDLYAARMTRVEFLGTGQGEARAAESPKTLIETVREGMPAQLRPLFDQLIAEV